MDPIRSIAEEVAQQEQDEAALDRIKKTFIATAKVLSRRGVSPTTLLKSAAAKAAKGGSKAKPKTGSKPLKKGAIVKAKDGSAFLVEAAEEDGSMSDAQVDEFLAGTRDEFLAGTR